MTFSIFRITVICHAQTATCIVHKFCSSKLSMHVETALVDAITNGVDSHLSLAFRGWRWWVVLKYIINTIHHVVSICPTVCLLWICGLINTVIQINLRHSIRQIPYLTSIVDWFAEYSTECYIAYNANWWCYNRCTEGTLLEGYLDEARWHR